jgi:hypothetical protein
MKMINANKFEDTFSICVWGTQKTFISGWSHVECICDEYSYCDQTKLVILGEHMFVFCLFIFVSKTMLMEKYGNIWKNISLQLG